MNKKMLAVVFAVTMVAGCATTQSGGPDQLQSQGKELKQKAYQVSKVENLEQARMKIHASFSVAENIFSNYLAKVEASPAYHQYAKATEGKSVEQVQAIRDDLRAQGKLGEIEAFEKANKALIMKTIALVIAFKQQAEAFSAVNNNDAFAALGFKDKMTEGLKVSATLDEMDYIKNATGQIIRLSAISQASQLLM